MKTPITRKQWRALKPGDGIMDQHNKVWVVKDRENGSDCLIVACMGYPEERLSWKDGCILDENGETLPVLNYSNVSIIPAKEITVS